MTYEKAMRQYDEAKHAMIEAQCAMEIAVENFTGTLQEAIDKRMVRFNFPASPNSFHVSEMKNQMRKMEY